MLKILNFFKTGENPTKLLTMRKRFERAQEEMNAVLTDMTEMPEISINAVERSIEIKAPDQFPDEALALPAPDTEETKDSSVEEADTAEQASDSASKAVKTQAA